MMPWRNSSIQTEELQQTMEEWNMLITTKHGLKINLAKTEVLQKLREGSSTCTRPSRDYNTYTRPSYDSLTTLPRPLRDAPRVYKKLILEELLQ